MKEHEWSIRPYDPCHDAGNVVGETNRVAVRHTKADTMIKDTAVLKARHSIIGRLALLLLCVIVSAACANIDSTDDIEFEASLAGVDLVDSSSSDPVKLSNADVVDLVIDACNVSSSEQTVEHVRLIGSMLNMTFLSYDTGVTVPIAAGACQQFQFPFDFFDLDGQGHGLLRSELVLYDGDRTALATRDLTVDLRGKAFSTMGLFNMLLAAVAIISLAWNLIRLSQRRLPANRFARALRFMSTGLAFGIAISAAFSVLRIWPLPTVTWVLITVVAALIGFALGYLTPGSDDAAIELLDEKDMADAVARHADDDALRQTLKQ